MAALTTQTNVTTQIAFNNEAPIAYGQAGLYIEVWRVAGGTVGDTIALTPKYIANIRSVIGTGGLAASHNISTAATASNTNVTFTLTASSATNVNFDITLLGQRNT